MSLKEMMTFHKLGLYSREKDVTDRLTHIALFHALAAYPASVSAM